MTATRGEHGDVLRVMTYNIWLGGRRGQPLTDVVRAADPDVLLVNECPKAPLVWRRDCRRLCHEWAMRYVAGGRPAGSNLIAVKRDIGVTSVHCEVLAQPRFQPRRGVAAAQLRVRGQLLGVVSCHLSLDRDRRAGEVERVLAIAGQLRGPVIVAGDLNEPPDGPSWSTLRRAAFVDHGTSSWKTFPSDHAARRIDALLVRGELTVRHHGDPGVPLELLAAGSDHRPVLATVGI